MARIVCQVLQRGDRISFLWSEGAASFEPYHLEGAERANLLQIAARGHAQLSGGGAELAHLGHQLYRAVFRRDAGDYGSAEAVQAWLGKLIEANSVEKIEFLSDAPGQIPWNLLCEAESAGFWGARFSLGAGRRVNALRQNPAVVAPMQFCAVDTELLGQLTPAQQVSLNPMRDAVKLAHSIAELEDGLRQRAPDILLLLVRFEKGQLRLGGESFGLADLQEWLAAPDEGNPDPLIVLMAIGGAEDQAIWQAYLALATASFTGVAANEAMLTAAQAFEVGYAIAQRFADGKQSLGEILRSLRQEQGGPALAFSAFCPPQVRVVAEGAADAPTAELPVEDLPLPALPYRPFAAFDVEERPLLVGRENDVLSGALAADRADASLIVLHGSPGVGKTSYLQAGLLPYLEQECVGYRVLRDRNPTSPPLETGETGYPILILRCTSDLAGQFADALTAFCAQPLTYTTPAGTPASVDLPGILQAAVSGVAAPVGGASTAIQSAPVASSITATPGEEDEGPDGDMSARELWIALRDDKDMLARLLDAVTRALPFELVIAVDQGEDLLALVRTEQQEMRRQKALGMLVQLAGAAPRCKIVFTIRSQALGQFTSLLPDGRLPDGWRPFSLRPLTEPELIDVLLTPTSDGEIPYSHEIPFQKYGFTYEGGVAAQIVTEAVSAAEAGQQNPLAIVHAAGALLFDVHVQGKQQNTVHASALKELGGAKQALAKCLDRTLDKLSVNSQARKSLRQLMSKLYLSHADGTLSRDLVSQSDLKSLWPSPAEPLEPAIDAAVQEAGLFDVQELLIGGQPDLYVSLPQDSLAQLANKSHGEPDRQAALRARTIDVLWVMIPLLFLAAAASFWVTKKYSGPDEADILKKLAEMRDDDTKKREDFMLSHLEQVHRPLYYAQMVQANQALNAHNTLYVRQALRDSANMVPPAIQKTYPERFPDLRSFEWHYAWREIHGERFPCDGHKGAVHALAVSPDGLWTASAGADGTARIWSVATGKPLAVIDISTSPLRAVAFAPDGKTLATAGADKVVRLWDISKLKADFLAIPKEIKSLPGHEGEIHALAFGKDANLLASAGADKTVILWDIAAGKDKHKLKEHAATVLALAFAPDGKTLVSAGEEADFIVWDAGAGKKTSTGKTPLRTIAALAIAPDGKLCTAGIDSAAGPDRGAARFWNLADGKELLKPIQHGSAILAVAFSPDGKSFASGGKDQVVRLWNLDTQTQTRYFLGHYDPIRGLAFAKDALVSAADDSHVKIWDPAVSSGPDILTAHNDWVQVLALTPKDTLLASGARDGAVKLWNPKTGQPAKLLDGETNQPLKDLPSQKGAIAALAFSFHEDKEPFYLAVGTRGHKDEGVIQVWQFTPADKDGWKVKLHASLKEHKKGVTCLAFSSALKQEHRLVSGSADHTVKLWDIKTGKEEASFAGHKDEVRCVAFSFDHTAVFSGGRDGNVCYNELDSKEIRTFTELHVGAIESIQVFASVGKDGDHLVDLNGMVTAGTDQAIRVWNYDQRVPNPKAKGLQRQLFWSHTQPVTSVAYQKRNTLLASASFDGTVKLYDLASERFTLVGHQDAVRAIVIAADQSFLASASNDKTVRIWRAAKKDGK